MNLPFVSSGPNTGTQRTTRRFLGLGGRNRDAERDEYDDTQQLSPRGTDLEAQERSSEMTERSSSQGGLLGRFPRPAIPSFFSTATTRRSAPRSGSHHPGGGQDEIESPKTPRFTLTIPSLPSARLHLPNLSRSWTQSSPTDSTSQPETSPAGGRASSGSHSSANINDETRPALPAPAYARENVPTRGSSSRVAESVPEMQERTRTRFRGADPAERHLAELAEDGRRRRDRRHGRQGSDGSRGSRENENENESENGDQGRDRRQERRRWRGNRGPKRFMLCFPWVESRRVRSQILRSLVSGLSLALILAVCKCARHRNRREIE